MLRAQRRGKDKITRERSEAATPPSSLPTTTRKFKKKKKGRMLPFLDMSSAQALPYPTPFKRAARHPPAAGAARERPPRRRRPSRPRAAPGRPRAHLRPRPARGGGVLGEHEAAPLGTCPPCRAKGPARRAPSAAASPKPGRGAGPGPSPPPAACNRWSAAGRSDDPWRRPVCLICPFVRPAIRTHTHAHPVLCRCCPLCPARGRSPRAGGGGARSLPSASATGTSRAARPPPPDSHWPSPGDGAPLIARLICPS